MRYFFIINPTKSDYIKKGDVHMMEKLPLKALRAKAGMKQYEMAEKLGVTTKTVWNWENGNTYPDADHIPKICELFNRPYDYIDFLPASPIKPD